jgi:hypothetical protein
MVLCGWKTYSALKVGSFHASLVLDDDIVTWLGGTLQGLMWLQKEVPGILTIASDMSIHNETRCWIMGAATVASVGIFYLGRVEPRVVAFTTDLNTLT